MNSPSVREHFVRKPKAEKSPAIRRAGLFAVLLAYGLYVGFAEGIGVLDEAWSLQVMRRVVSGEALYKDVAFGLGPLSVYIVYPLVRIFGIEIAAVKLAVAASYAGSLALGFGILKKLGLGARAGLVYVSAAFALAPPVVTSAYQSLSIFLLMGTFWIVVEAASTEAAGRLLKLAAAGGLTSGLAFVTKQTVGGVAIVATAASLILLTRMRRVGEGRWLAESLGFSRARLEPALAAVAAFLASAMVVHLPHVLSGTWRAYLRYGYLAKKLSGGRRGLLYRGYQEVLRPLRTSGPAGDS